MSGLQKSTTPPLPINLIKLIQCSPKIPHFCNTTPTSTLLTPQVLQL